jgi:hypothetical protein
MSYIDVAIPGLIGLVAVIRPQVMFYGSRAAPDPRKLNILRGIGAALLVAALIYLGIKIAAA